MRFLLTIPIAFVALILQSVRLAMSQIWANKVRSVLTTLGIIIGVASVTSVIAALSGLKAKIMSDLETFGTNKIYVWPQWPDSGPMRRASWQLIRFRPEQFDGLVENCPAVARLTKISERGQTIRHGERSIENARVYGIEPTWHKIESRPVLMGRPFSLVDDMQGRLVCLVDPTLRDKLRLDKDCTGQSIIIGHYTFRIVGVVEKQPSLAMIGGGGGGSRFEVFIPFGTFYKIFSQPWFHVIAASQSPEVSEEAKSQLTFYLRQMRRIRPNEPDTFGVESVESHVRTFNQIARRFTMVAGGIVGISLIVGGIGIMNIMLVSVSERTREIGLRKAVGAKSSAILTQFLVEAVVLCCLGGLLGVLLGQGLTQIIAGIPGVNLDQAYIPAWAVMMSFGFSAAVGIFFGMFPAVKAARLDPIEALRHE